MDSLYVCVYRTRVYMLGWHLEPQCAPWTNMNFETRLLVGFVELTMTAENLSANSPCILLLDC